MIHIAKPVMGEAEKKAVMAVLDSGMIAQGPAVKRFEEAFAKYIGVKHAVATNSGTSALHVALLASGIGPGDEVIVPAFTFIATSNAVLFTGARPVFADIDADSFNISVESVKEKITPKTRAVIPVHLYGQPCDMKELVGLCESRGIRLIEDACQAHGAEYNGRKAGSFGTGVFSFYPTKNMTASEGGMITTNDDGVAARARTIRNHGQSERYRHDVLGFNHRMTDVSAAIGMAQLEGLEGMNSRRISNASFFSKELAGLEGIKTPSTKEGRKHVFHQYTIRVLSGKRDRLKQFLEEKGIGSCVYYPITNNRQKLYTDLGYGNESLPASEQACKEVLSIPVHPQLGKQELEAIVSAIKEFCKEGTKR